MYESTCIPKRVRFILQDFTKRLDLPVHMMAMLGVVFVQFVVRELSTGSVSKK